MVEIINFIDLFINHKNKIVFFLIRQDFLNLKSLIFGKPPQTKKKNSYKSSYLFKIL